MLLLLASIPFVSLQGGEYEGRFRGHPALEKVEEFTSMTISGEPEPPDWLVKRAPRLTVRLVDLEKPIEHHGWPGDVDASISTELDGKDTILTIELPIDTFIAEPGLVKHAIDRLVFGAASMARAMRDGTDFTAIYGWGISNPLVEAMAAHWAGTLDEEIEFALRRHLLSDDDLASLLRPIEPLDAGNLNLPHEGPDDLTWLVLVKMLAPSKKDSKLEKLYVALSRGQSLEGALKKASGKNLVKLNAKLADFYDEYVEDRFPKKGREAFREAWAAMQSGDTERVIESLGDWDRSDFLTHHFLFLVASCMTGPAPESPEEGWIRFLESPLHYTDCDLGPVALRRYGNVLLKQGRAEDRREVYERLRDHYGWLEGVREEAAKALD